jgi:hypothetical protein
VGRASRVQRAPRAVRGLGDIDPTDEEAVSEAFALFEEDADPELAAAVAARPASG